MNRKPSLILAIAASAFIGSAFADDITVDPAANQSTRAREEVQAELAACQAACRAPWADDYNQVADFHGDKGRAAATAGSLAGRKQVAAAPGEDSGAMGPARSHMGADLQAAGEPVQAR
jgi:hypothetical protein